MSGAGCTGPPAAAGGRVRLGDMTFLEKIAVALIAGSWVVAAGILLLPFLDIGHSRVVAAVGVYLVSQGIFWAGCAIGGRELVRRYRERFPWLSWPTGFRRRG